ncbi:MAG: hypothetical protein RL117_1603 [Verrucomicrobiota bacterium]|jgi:hypothetical protein
MNDLQHQLVKLLIGMMALSSCGPDLKAIPEPDESMALAMGVRESELQRGHTTYMAHCQKCHPRVPPGKIDPEAWREILPHMSQNAKLRPTEYDELQLYLIAAHGTVHQLDLQH